MSKKKDVKTLKLFWDDMAVGSQMNKNSSTFLFIFAKWSVVNHCMDFHLGRWNVKRELLGK